LKPTRARREGERLQVQPLLVSATMRWRNQTPLATFSSNLFEGSENADTSGNARKCHGSNPYTALGFLLQSTLRAVSVQLLLTDGSVVRSHLRFGV